jgi:UPF0271 protein
MPAARAIDLNADMGESFGAWSMGADASLLDIVTSANIACGFHAGDPDTMAASYALARARNVAIGAHPGFQDLVGFGRRRIPMSLPSVERMVAYQIGAAQALAALVGHQITYVKAHGALGNWAAEDIDAAMAVARAIKAVDASLVSLAIAGTAAERAARSLGLTVASEIFADRGYREDGTLVPRGEAGAMVHDPQQAATRVLAMIEAGGIIATTGKVVPVNIDSICVHGDGPNAVAVARAVRDAIIAKGFDLRAFAPAHV